MFRQIDEKVCILRFVVRRYRQHNLFDEACLTFFDLSCCSPVQFNLQHQSETMAGTERGYYGGRASQKWAKMKAGAKLDSLRRERCNCWFGLINREFPVLFYFKEQPCFQPPLQTTGFHFMWMSHLKPWLLVAEVHQRYFLQSTVILWAHSYRISTVHIKQVMLHCLVCQPGCDSSSGYIWIWK